MRALSTEPDRNCRVQNERSQVHTVTVMPLKNRHTEHLIAQFLARGGTIRKIPTPQPTTASDVLEYLNDHNVDFRAVAEPGEFVSKYMYKHRIITEKQLVSIANKHRARRGLPAFESLIQDEDKMQRRN